MAARRAAVPRRGAIVADIVQAYLNGATSHCAAKPQTVRRNAGCLLRVLRIAFGASDDAVMRMPASVALGPDVVSRYQSARRRAALEGGQLDQVRARRTADSEMRQARSMFSREVRPVYADLEMPDLTAFREASMMGRHGDLSYQPFSGSEDRAMMRAAVSARRAGDVDLWLSYVLMRFGGLRDNEVLAVRRSWLVAGRIEIRVREDFSPKWGRSRIVPLPASVLRRIPDGAPDAWLLLPEATPTFRQNHVYRKLNGMLRPHLLGRVKAAYELRKHFGSVIAQEQGIEAAQYLLGHQSITTTQKHYASVLDANRFRPVGGR